MTTSLASIVDLVHPTVSGIGVIVADQIWVLFDREIDETTVAAGNFFVTGPDFDTWSGPDLQLYVDAEQLGDETEILQSPGFHGLVQGDITFERKATDSLTTISGLDTVGSGFLYRSKAIFTPSNRLQVNHVYTVYLSGDEDDTDAYSTGISSRTVFDPVTSGANTGTGSVVFDGGYIGNVALDTYRIAITTSGEVGTAKFTFTRDFDPLSVYGPFKTKYSGVLLSDGVTVEFEEGLYRTGDQWSVVVRERDIFDGNMYWPFQTGSGSIETIPDTTATSVIGDPVAPTTTPTSSTSFSVSSTSPADDASNVTIPTGPYNITVTFNDNINAATVVSGVDVSVFTESVSGEDDLPASGFCIAEPSVSGSDLTIIVASGFLLQNNLVTVTLDSTIQSTGGTSLGSDYEFSFSTTYSPMYCTLRKMRLMIGAYISNVADDTVNLAIFLASREAQQLTWNTENLSDEYYQFARGQWVCCRAAQLLLMNTVGGSGSLKSKRLGDLAVEYDVSGNVIKPLTNAEDCLLKWEGALMAGGRQVQTPTMVVKGELDGDRPPIGRGWLHTRDLHGTQTPAANRRLRLWNSRRYRNVFSRRRGWWER